MRRMAEEDGHSGKKKKKSKRRRSSSEECEWVESSTGHPEAGQHHSNMETFESLKREDWMTVPLPTSSRDSSALVPSRPPHKVNLQ